MCPWQMTEVFTGGLSNEVLESLIGGIASQEEKQLCCLVAHTQHNCVSFWVDTSWYTQMTAVILVLISYCTWNWEQKRILCLPVPSFFIAWQVLWKCYLPHFID